MSTFGIPKNFKRKASKGGIIYSRPCGECTLSIDVFTHVCPGLELSSRAYSSGLPPREDPPTPDGATHKFSIDFFSTEAGMKETLHQFRQRAKTLGCETRRLFISGQTEFIEAMKRKGFSVEKE